MLLALALMTGAFLLGPGTARADTVDVFIGSHQIPEGELRTIPVECSDVTGLSVVACHLRLVYSGDVVETHTSLVSAGNIWPPGSTMSESVIVDSTGNLKVLYVVIAAATVGSGAGTLCEVRFRAIGDPGDFTPVDLLCELNEGEPMANCSSGLLTIPGGGSAVDPMEPRLITSLEVTPNPTAGAQTLRLALERPGVVALEFLDAQGRLIWKSQETLSAGVHVIRPPVGDRLPAGVYYWHARQGDVLELTRKVVFVR